MPTGGGANSRALAISGWLAGVYLNGWSAKKH